MLAVPAICLPVQSAVAQPAPLAVPILADELPRAARAAPDEVVRRNEAGDEPVAPVERELRLVASDARMARGDVPMLSVASDPEPAPPPGASPPAGEALSPAPAAAVPVAARATARPDTRDRPSPAGLSPADPAPPAASGRARWLWLAPLVCFFLLMAGWLVWARRRGREAASMLRREEEVAFPSIASELPFRPGARLGRLPRAKEPPAHAPASHPAPRRLADALAGLKAELGDWPREEGAAPAVRGAG